MVQRSTLDPIAEARARVRLRYLRGRKERLYAKPVSLGAERLVRKRGGKKMPAIAVLRTRWEDIVGPKLYRYCRPEKIIGGKDGRVLVLTVLSAAAPMVQHQAETIRQRVSVAAGGDIAAIKLKHGALPGGAAMRPRKRLRALTADEAAKIQTQTDKIEQPALRAAIVALGTAVLTAEPAEPTRPTQKTDLPF